MEAVGFRPGRCCRSLRLRKQSRGTRQSERRFETARCGVQNGVCILAGKPDGNLHIRSGAESPQDSARSFENARISSGDSGSEQKLGTCSVDIILYEINFTAVQAYLQHRAILYGKLRVPSVQGGVHGKTDVNISPETMLDGSLTLLMLGENQKLENTSTCKNLYRYNSQRPLAGVLLDNVKRMVYPSFKRE